MIDMSYCPKNDTVVLVSPEGEHYTIKDDLEFNYIRGQICRWKYQDYKVLYHNKLYDINTDGDIIDRPEGIFTENDNQLCYIMEYMDLYEQDDLRNDEILFEEKMIEEILEKKEILNF